MTPPDQSKATLSFGETRWTVHGPFNDLLFDERGLKLKQWLKSGQATLIKSGPGRLIYRVNLPGAAFYIKHFRSVKMFHFLHRIIKKDRARKEYESAKYLSKIGIATINPMAIGERRKYGVLVESFLISEAIPNGMTMHEFIERHILGGHVPLTARFRFQLTFELAKLAAKIHEAGIEHRDLHERNVIVQLDPEGNVKLFLLDLHEMVIHKSLDWECSRRELARLGRYFTLRTSCSDRMRFFRQYAKLRGFPVQKLIKLIADAENYTIETRADFWIRRDNRPQHKNPRVFEYNSAGVQALAIQDIPEETVRKLMEDPGAPFRDHVSHWWKRGRFTQVAEVKLPYVHKNQPLIYKQHFFKGWHESAAALVRRNQATRAWAFGGSLILRELPTPKPLAFIQIMKFGMPYTSYLLTECVENPMGLTQYLDVHLPNLEGKERTRVLRGVLHEAALLLRMMHDRRVTHRDLKTSNVLATPTADLARPKLWIIDLDGAKTWQRIPIHHRIQNLSRFFVSFYSSPWVSQADRMRFLRDYLGKAFENRVFRNWLWREIGHSAKAKIARNIRRGRAVA